MKQRSIFATLLGALAVACIMAPAAARADNNKCPNAEYVFLGESAPHFFQYADNRYYKTYLTAGRSYAVLAWGTGRDALDGGVDLAVRVFTNNTCTTQADGQTQADFEPATAALGHDGDMRSIVPTTDGTVYIRLRNQNDYGGFEAHLLVIETTLFSPWWFTGGTNQAFVEIRNNMSSSTTAHVTLYRSDGTVCGTTSVAIGANGNTAVEVNGMGTCAGAMAGSAQIAFAGTPEGLGGNITTISVPDGTSFDSPFTPRMTWGTSSITASFAKEEH